MKLNFFDKYIIDTDNLEEKLDIISKSETENASYITHILKNAIEYLYSDVELKIENIEKGFPKEIEKLDAIIYFETLDKKEFPEELIQISKKTKLIIVGNHIYSKPLENIVFIPINNWNKIKAEINKNKKIALGIDIEKIDFDKYYYNRMRNYFLNVVNLLDKITLDELKEDVELSCQKILLNKENFEAKNEICLENIDFKKVINLYKKLLRLNQNFDFNFFYTSKIEIGNKEKMKLNQFSLLLKMFSIKDKKERYSFLYDTVCSDMLNEISKLNYCHFINDKCIKMRYTDGFPNSKENGCCANTYKDKNKNCRYLKEDHSCSICSISCRIFTCAYLQERGIDHSLWQYPIIDCSMNKFKKAKIIYNFFTPKEETLHRLCKSI